MALASPNTVLIVEDEVAVRELLAQFLRDEGFDVEEAQDGLEAIDALNRHRPPPVKLCVVLLDMMLPHADGVQVLNHLNALSSYVPVVAMSASRERLVDASGAGAQATIAKPFDLDQMLAVVTSSSLR